MAVEYDGTDPVLSIGGTLKAAEGQPLTQPTYELTMAATDGVATQALTQRSGVASVEVLVDGTQTYFGELDCPQSSCAVNDSWAYQASAFGPGEHAITVVARDQLGHRDTEELTVGTATEEPMESTEFVFDEPVALGDVVDPLADVGANPERFEDDHGGYVAEDGVTLETATSEYRDQYSYLMALDEAVAAIPEDELTEVPDVEDTMDVVEPPVSSVTVSGDVATSALGALSTEVAERREIPVPEPPPTPDADPDPVLMAGGLPDWVPAKTKLVVGRRNEEWGVMITKVRFTQNQIDALTPNAFELDVKLYSGRNRNSGRGYLDPWPPDLSGLDWCSWGELDNFYIHRPEHSAGWDRFGHGRGSWFTRLPSSYLDTKFLDPCRQEDMTVGVYQTSQLIPDFQYRTIMVWRRGDKKRSKFSLGVQKLTKNCDPSTGQPGAYCEKFECPGRTVARGAFCTGLDSNRTRTFTWFAKSRSSTVPGCVKGTRDPARGERC